MDLKNNVQSEEMRLITADLEKIFNLLKVPGSEKEEIEHSTLMALLLYSNVDKDEPEYFFNLKRSIETLEKKQQNTQTIAKQDFIRIFLDPEISYQNLKIDEMSSIFKIFDKEKKGSFSAEDFLYFFRQAPEFKIKSFKEQEVLEGRIRKEFDEISEAREITPIEFYKIVNSMN